MQVFPEEEETCEGGDGIKNENVGNAFAVDEKGRDGRKEEGG